MAERTYSTHHIVNFQCIRDEQIEDFYQGRSAAFQFGGFRETIKDFYHRVEGLRELAAYFLVFSGPFGLAQHHSTSHMPGIIVLALSRICDMPLISFVVRSADNCIDAYCTERSKPFISEHGQEQPFHQPDTLFISMTNLL